MLHTHTYAEQLFLSDFLRERVIRAAIEALSLPRGSRGLDVGCGIGGPACWLAEAVGPDGHVTGLDLSVPFLKQARHRAEESGLSKPISFGAGDMLRLPFGRQTFDWVWSLDCAGAVGNDPMPLIRELSRVTRSGGRIAVLIWSSQQLLPGYPLLEARLNSTAAGLAPFREGMPPETHILRMRGWLRRAGLKQVEVQTFVGDVCAPLSDPIRRAMISLFDMRWGGARSEVSSADWAQYERLCTPESPDFILDQPDYYGFFTYSLFHARAPG